MENKKGQAALEYLLTYGWAILIIIIVGASLYSLGIFTPGQWTGRRQTGFAQFRVTDFKLDTDGNLTIILQNQVGKPITLDSVNATLKQVMCSEDSGSPIGGSILPNSIYTVVLECGSGSDWKMPLKSSYSITLDFHYTDGDSGLTHIDSGSLFGAVEQP